MKMHPMATMVALARPRLACPRRLLQTWVLLPSQGNRNMVAEPITGGSTAPVLDPPAEATDAPDCVLPIEQWSAVATPVSTPRRGRSSRAGSPMPDEPVWGRDSLQFQKTVQTVEREHQKLKDVISTLETISRETVSHK